MFFILLFIFDPELNYSAITIVEVESKAAKSQPQQEDHQKIKLINENLMSRAFRF